MTTGKRAAKTGSAPPVSSWTTALPQLLLLLSPPIQTIVQASTSTIAQLMALQFLATIVGACTLSINSSSQVCRWRGAARVSAIFGNVLFCAGAASALSLPNQQKQHQQQRRHPMRRRVAIIGGGPSGIFSSIAAATTARTLEVGRKPRSGRQQKVQVTVFEATSQTLAKVKISGGGRCNVLHDTSKPVPELLQGYPRGYRELNGLLHSRFSPQQAREWFERRGNVTLKTESDGRMFPVTDSSQTVVDALLSNAANEIVSIRTKCRVESVSLAEEQSVGGSAFRIELKDNEACFFDAVILATGSARLGYEIARSLGHTIVRPVPSLFTLSTKHDVQDTGLLHGLAGVSVPRARIAFKMPTDRPPNDDATTAASAPKRKRNKKSQLIEQEGPLLITHHGLSGPAALRLSAFGARRFAETNYRGQLAVHWAPDLGNADTIADALWKVTTTNPKKAVCTVCPLTLPGTCEDGSDIGRATAAIPKRLWLAMVKAAGIDIDRTEKPFVWGDASKKLVRKLALKIAECSLELTSKGTFKEEFVTAGGVALNEIDMRTMQSRVCPGLFFCGELINVDGVTGGYNFMNCWYVCYKVLELYSSMALLHISAIKFLLQASLVIL